METFSPRPELASDQPPTDQMEAGSLDSGMQYCRRVLLGLVEMGHELASIVTEEARAIRDTTPVPTPTPSPTPTQQAVAAYADVTRAIRRTVMLYDKLGTPKKPRANRVAARKRIIRDVEDAIQREAPEDEQETLHAEFLERLDSPDLDDEIAERPVADIVIDITRDLGIAGLYDSHPWKRRIPHDIAVLNALAEQCSGAEPSERLRALRAAAPPRPPRRTVHRGPPLNIAKMSDEDIAIRLKILGYPRES